MRSRRGGSRPPPPPPYGNIIFLNLRSKNYRNMPPPRCKLKISLGLPLRLFFFGGGYSRVLFVTKMWAFLKLLTGLFIKKQLATLNWGLSTTSTISQFFFTCKYWTRHGFFKVLLICLSNRIFATFALFSTFLCHRQCTVHSYYSTLLFYNQITSLLTININRVLGKLV